MLSFAFSASIKHGCLILCVLSIIQCAFAQDGGSFVLDSSYEGAWLKLDYVAGGEHRSQERFPLPECVGYITKNPDHLLTLKEDIANLHLFVRAEGDSALIVYDETNKETFCSDDDQYYHPGILRDWKAGVYHIYVASYYPNEHLRYSFYIGLGRFDSLGSPDSPNRTP